MDRRFGSYGRRARRMLFIGAEDPWAQLSIRYEIPHHHTEGT
jgi:hypothetical protein